MDILYRRGRATAAEVMAEMTAPPTYSAVRAKLRILEEKRHVRHEQDGLAYVFLPTVPAQAARRSAVRHLLGTFFGGSAERAVAAVIEASQARLSKEERVRITELIDATAKKEKR